jgi:hypothetical protein
MQSNAQDSASRPGRGTGRLLPFAAAVLLALALPAAALARPARSFPASPDELCAQHRVVLGVTYYCQYEFTLPASNGYRITVSAEKGAGGGQVELTAERGAESASYAVSGSVTAAGFSASFGQLGRVAVRFRPSARLRHRRLPHRCFPNRPPLVSSQLGSFRGVIRFRGERGYTRLFAHHASGALGDPASNVAKLPGCELRGSKSQHSRQDRAVTLQASVPRPPVSFQASRAFGRLAQLPSLGPTQAGDRDLFLALAFDAPHGFAGPNKILIVRSAAALAPSAYFVFDSGLTQATVAPPAPFSGSATFQRNAGGSSSTWTGDLAVSLPGLGTVSLTAPRARAQLAPLADLERQGESATGSR